MAASEEIAQWQDWLTRFLTAKRASNRSHHTLVSYTYHLTAYLAWLGRREQDGIDIGLPETIEAFIVHEQEAGYSPHTIAGRFRSLRVWYNFLVRRVKCLAATPFADLEAPGLPNDVRPHVSLLQFQRLIDSIEPTTWFDCRDRCILYLLYWCGLRVSELTGLRRSHVDVVRQVVTIAAGKGGKGRLVPCGNDLGPMLRAYLMKRPLTHNGLNIPGSPLLISNDGNGGARAALTDNGVRQMLRRRCKDAGIEYQNPHRFRHGYAMLFLNHGMDLSAVSKTMGHASEQFTARIYAHWLPEGIRREYQDVRRKVAPGG